MGPRILVLVAALWLAAAPAHAHAASRITPDEVVVTASGGASVTITRSPVRISFADATGRPVLSEVARAEDTRLIPPTTDAQLSTRSTPPPTLYAPLHFLVGTQQIQQVPAGNFSGNLAAVVTSGTEYAAKDVVDAEPDGDGVKLTLSTTDPSGRRLVVTVAPSSRGAGLRLSARPSPADGVAAMGDAFTTTGSEAFRGFGGMHEGLDQHGQRFLNWLQQENVSSGSLGGLSAPLQGGNGDVLFPNGPHARYYVQSLFSSSAGYGFLLDRTELSDWRLASDRGDAWSVSAGAPGLDYVVVPGDAPTSVAGLTAITGHHPLAPEWARGTILDREIKLNQNAQEYIADVEDDLEAIDRFGVHIDGYRIEGWQYMPKADLTRLIGELRRRGIHPMVYLKAFVGQDDLDSSAAYDEAISKGYVARRADGSPYTYVTNYNRLGAVIDFTNPAAVAWWKARVRAALDLGADGFMEDFGEQVQTDMHFADGSTGVQMHNRLPVLYHRATRELVQQYEQEHPGRQIWFFTRSGYSGSPGSQASEGGNFVGDATTDWTRSAGIGSQIPDMLNRGIGGAFGTTFDIGGYWDIGPYEPTTKELFIRWTELTALTPFFRVHGSVLAGTHTPWSYDAETLRIFNAYAELHRRARPLVAKLWAQADRDGLPITRPLWLGDPGTAGVADEDQEFLLGTDVLVAPVVDEGATSRVVTFPSGCWERADTGQRYAGPTKATVPAALADLPWFVRCGTDPLGAATAAKRTCTSRRSIAITVPVRRGEQLRSARVTVAGKAVSATRRGARVRFSLAGRAKGTVVVRVVARTTRGRAVVVRRTYRLCAGRRVARTAR